MIPNSKPIELIEDGTNDKKKMKGKFNAQSYPENFLLCLNQSFLKNLLTSNISSIMYLVFILIKIIILITVTIH